MVRVRLSPRTKLSGFVKSLCVCVNMRVRSVEGRTVEFLPPVRKKSDADDYMIILCSTSPHGYRCRCRVTVSPVCEC